MKKFLVIRFSSIGDIVLTTPVVRCLKQQFPGAVVHFIVKRNFAGVLQGNPGIDRLWSYDGSMDDLLPQLKAEKYDHVIDLHRSLRSFLLRTRLGVKGSSFPKLNLLKWMAVNLKLNLLPQKHIVDRYFEAVGRLGIVNDGAGLDFFTTPSDRQAVSELPLSHAGGYLAVVAGAKHGTKIFPAHKVADVCKKASLPVVLLGGAEDRERGDEIVRLAGGTVFNGCGKFSLGQSAALIEASYAVLANDTGLMHIAAALEKPVVSVWGNTIPAFGMTPYYPRDNGVHSKIMEIHGLSCRPCSKIGFEKCPKGHFRCMEEIETMPIAEFLVRSFENGRTRNENHNSISQ